MPARPFFIEVRFRPVWTDPGRILLPMETPASQSEIFERARIARDGRFDGRFFVGVRTTGIYCRPICPANLPKRENVTIYPTAAAAAEAGYRPCLRCRPECAPGTPAWAGTSTTVQRGLRMIADGALDDGDVEGLAEKLGVTSRHLRRLFTRHLGASPLAVAQTRRLHFAKQLIDDTALPMRDIAFAAGFGSVRRFNDTLQQTYGRSPRDLRRLGAPVGDVAGLRLACREPFDWAALVGFLAARAIPGVECVSPGRYLRSVEVDGKSGILDVRLVNGRPILFLHGIDTRSLLPVVQRVRALFDLDAGVAEIADVLRRDDVLRGLVDARPGFRLPGAWDGFELAVRAVLGQQISVRAATTLAGRIVAAYGEPIDIDVAGADAVPDRLFPVPARLVRARLERLGLTRSRAQTIRELARAVNDGHIGFDAARDPVQIREALAAIRGIGPWTTEYIAMRALKDPDALPAADLGLLRAFDADTGRRLRPAELAARAEAWRPWRAYAAILIWGSGSGAGG